MSDQSTQMLRLLSQIESNTRRSGSNQRNTSTPQSEIGAQAANSMSSADDANAVADAFSSQADALNRVSDAMNSASESSGNYNDAVQNSLSYAEKLQELAEKRGSFVAYGKMIDDVFGGKIGKAAKSIGGFLGKIRDSGKTLGSFRSEFGKLNGELKNTGASGFLKWGARLNFAAGTIAKILGPIGIAAAAIGGTMIKIFTQTFLRNE